MVLVSLIGAHGVGKTYTACILSKNGFVLKSIEVISEAHGLPPIERQLVFFSEYVRNYIKIYREAEKSRYPVIADSHPLLVIPYTEYWLRKAGYGVSDVRKIVNSMITLILMLPKSDLFVLIHPEKVDTVISRILCRNRFNIEEEKERKYVEFIINKTHEYFMKYAKNLSHHHIIMPAELEGEKRASIITNRLLEIM